MEPAEASPSLLTTDRVLEALAGAAEPSCSQLTRPPRSEDAGGSPGPTGSRPGQVFSPRDRRTIRKSCPSLPVLEPVASTPRRRAFGSLMRLYRRQHPLDSRPLLRCVCQGAVRGSSRNGKTAGRAATESIRTPRAIWRGRDTQDRDGLPVSYPVRREPEPAPRGDGAARYRPRSWAFLASNSASEITPCSRSLANLPSSSAAEAWPPRSARAVCAPSASFAESLSAVRK